MAPRPLLLPADPTLIRGRGKAKKRRLPEELLAASLPSLPEKRIKLPLDRPRSKLDREKKRSKLASEKERSHLSRLESLPAELLEHIFSYLDTPDLPLASPLIGARLSTDAVYNRIMRDLCVPPSPAFWWWVITEEAQSEREDKIERLVNLRWWNGERFMHMMQLYGKADAHYKAGMNKKESRKMLMYNWEHLKDCLSSQEFYGLVSGFRYLPDKLLRWPMSDTERQLLFILEHYELSPDSRSLAGEIGQESLLKAIITGDYEAVDLLMVFTLYLPSINDAILKQVLSSINFEPAMVYLVLTNRDPYQRVNEWNFDEGLIAKKYPSVLPQAKALHPEFWALRPKRRHRVAKQKWQQWEQEREERKLREAQQEVKKSQ